MDSTFLYSLIKVRNINRETKYTYIAVSDNVCVCAGGAVSQKYGSLLDLGFIGKFSNRQTYIISPKGDIEYVFTDVDSRVNQHSGDVLAKLKELSS